MSSVVARIHEANHTIAPGNVTDYSLTTGDIVGLSIGWALFILFLVAFLIKYSYRWRLGKKAHMMQEQELTEEDLMMVTMPADEASMNVRRGRSLLDDDML